VRRTVWHSHTLFHVLITFLVAVMDAENRCARMIVFRKYAGATLAHSAVAFFGNRCQDL
jgi:hypothetical protein